MEINKTGQGVPFKNVFLLANVVNASEVEWLSFAFIGKGSAVHRGVGIASKQKIFKLTECSWGV